MMKFLTVPLLFLVSSCAFQRLAVTQLDNIIEIETASKLDLYRSQKKVLESDVTALLESQKSHTEEFTKLLKKIAPRKTEQFPILWGEISAEYRRIALAFSGLLAKHLVTLDPKQRAHFFSKMESDNQDILTKSEKQDVESVAKRVSLFFGEVSVEQEKVLLRNLPEIKRRTLARLARRQNLHKNLADILSSSSFAADKERRILSAFENYQLDASLEQEVVIKMMQDLCQGLSEKQLSHFQEKRQELLDLIAVFKSTKF